MDWDLLRTFEAVARLGSFTAAATSLGISQSSVSRHIDRLEAEAVSPLFVRKPSPRLTTRGENLLRSLSLMSEGAMAARSALQAGPTVQGEVTVTTVGEVLRWTLVEHLETFYAQYPDVRLRILADYQVISLATEEADIALRFARPERGDLVIRRLFTETYGFFVAEGCPFDPEMPWLGLTGALARIPEQVFAAQCFGHRPPRLLLEDVESLGKAVARGLGVALLARTLAESSPGLKEVGAPDVGATLPGPMPTRGLWKLIHRSKYELPKIRAVSQWLDRIFSQFDCGEKS
ncbi:MAG: LysR family transcriptional regulator [Nannocystaceae bacterium]